MRYVGDYRRLDLPVRSAVEIHRFVFFNLKREKTNKENIELANNRMTSVESSLEKIAKYVQVRGSVNMTTMFDV